MNISKFEEDPPRQNISQGNHHADIFLLNIDGYEGPIELLLDMARDQKVDLAQISILQLARQYIEFVDRAKELELDLAAEYLVMASWLAYLKSRLLLPKDENDDEPSGEEMAEALQFQLLRLEAMRNAADQLFALPQLGQDIFSCRTREGLKTHTKAVWDVTFYDILQAYGEINRRNESSNYELPVFQLMSMEHAIDRVSKMLGKLPRKGPFSVWTTLQSFLPEVIKDKLFGRSAVSSIFTAGLEMAKQGKVDIKQDGAFRPIYLRAKSTATEIENNEGTNNARTAAK